MEKIEEQREVEVCSFSLFRPSYILLLDVYKKQNKEKKYFLTKQILNLLEEKLKANDNNKGSHQNFVQLHWKGISNKFGYVKFIEYNKSDEKILYSISNTQQLDDYADKLYEKYGIKYY